jgi:prepilin-type N-terminal cleavage/methylation domain-containing protein
MRLTRRLRDSRGFTLVELLVTITIMGLIIGQRLGESHDAQIVNAYFGQDVQSIGVRDWATAPFALKQSVELDAPPTSGLYPCGAAGTPNAVVRMAWDDPDLPTHNQPVVVSYVVQTVGAERQLRRITCVGTAAPVILVVAHDLDPTPPGPAPAQPVTVACPTSCTAAPALPATITMTLVIRDPADAAGRLTVTLTGQRRTT